MFVDSSLNDIEFTYPEVAELNYVIEYKSHNI